MSLGTPNLGRGYTLWPGLVILPTFFPAEPVVTTRIAMAQTTTTDVVADNLKVARELVAAAVDAGVDMLAFPEIFLFLGGRKKKLEIAEPLDGPLISEFREHAARHDLPMLLGSYHERIDHDAERVHNTSVLLDGRGEIQAVYRKIKLFDVELPHLRLKESDTIVAGTQMAPVVQMPFGRVGLTICFDLRFSPLYQSLRRQGAEIIFVPSNFTAPTGKAHWEVLLRARAIEHQVFVLAPAQYGQHNPKYASHGQTMAVDPWGRIIAQLPKGTGLCVAELDMEILRKVRSELPMHVPAPESKVTEPESGKPLTTGTALDL